VDAASALAVALQLNKKFSRTSLRNRNSIDDLMKFCTVKCFLAFDVKVK